MLKMAAHPIIDVVGTRPFVFLVGLKQGAPRFENY